MSLYRVSERERKKTLLLVWFSGSIWQYDKVILEGVFLQHTTSLSKSTLSISLYPSTLLTKQKCDFKSIHMEQESSLSRRTWMWVFDPIPKHFKTWQLMYFRVVDPKHPLLYIESGWGLRAVKHQKGQNAPYKHSKIRTRMIYFQSSEPI